MSCKFYIHTVLAFLLCSCASGPGPSPSMQPEISPDEPTFGEPILEDEPDPVTYYRVPDGYYFLGFNERSNVLILGNNVTPQITIYSLQTGRVELIPISFVPRVGITLSPKIGHAIFGHAPRTNRRGNYIVADELEPTSSYIVMLDTEVVERELAEPIAATDGLLWDETKQVILADSWAQSQALVFIDVGDLVMSNEYVRLARLILDDSPYDIEKVSWRHLAISYVDSRKIELFDLEHSKHAGFVDRSIYEAKTLISEIQSDLGLFATFNFVQSSAGRLTRSRGNIDVLRLLPTKGGTYDSSRVDRVTFATSSRDPIETDSPHSRWGAFNAVRIDGGSILLSAQVNLLNISLVTYDDSGYEISTQEKEPLTLQTRRIQRIDVPLNADRVFVSAPDDGLIIAIDKEFLIHR